MSLRHRLTQLDDRRIAAALAAYEACAGAGSRERRARTGDVQ